MTISLRWPPTSKAWPPVNDPLVDRVTATYVGLAILLAIAPTRITAATLVPGGGNRRTDCQLQMSAEGVGFPAGKTPKGVSCADGDVCDLDGQRNGVCVFQVSLCLNQPTRACQAFGGCVL